MVTSIVPSAAAVVSYVARPRKDLDVSVPRGAGADVVRRAFEEFVEDGLPGVKVEASRAVPVEAARVGARAARPGVGAIEDGRLRVTLGGGDSAICESRWSRTSMVIATPR